MAGFRPKCKRVTGALRSDRGVLSPLGPEVTFFLPRDRRAPVLGRSKATKCMRARILETSRTSLPCCGRGRPHPDSGQLPRYFAAHWDLEPKRQERGQLCPRVPKPQFARTWLSALRAPVHRDRKRYRFNLALFLFNVPWQFRDKQKILPNQIHLSNVSLFEC